MNGMPERGAMMNVIDINKLTPAELETAVAKGLLTVEASDERWGLLSQCANAAQRDLDAGIRIGCPTWGYDRLRFVADGKASFDQASAVAWDTPGAYHLRRVLLDELEPCETSVGGSIFKGAPLHEIHAARTLRAVCGACFIEHEELASALQDPGCWETWDDPNVDAQVFGHTGWLYWAGYDWCEAVSLTADGYIGHKDVTSWEDARKAALACPTEKRIKGRWKDRPEEGLRGLMRPSV